MQYTLKNIYIYAKYHRNVTIRTVRLDNRNPSFARWHSICLFDRFLPTLKFQCQSMSIASAPSRFLHGFSSARLTSILTKVQPFCSCSCLRSGCKLQIRRDGKIWDFRGPSWVPHQWPIPIEPEISHPKAMVFHIPTDGRHSALLPLFILLEPGEGIECS